MCHTGYGCEETACIFITLSLGILSYTTNAGHKTLIVMLAKLTRGYYLGTAV